uniref:Uncharacterized protein n=1 Tax=Ammonifex degensii TaxID=42838 RepID=A0A7C1IZV1_9THEO
MPQRFFSLICTLFAALIVLFFPPAGTAQAYLSAADYYVQWNRSGVAYPSASSGSLPTTGTPLVSAGQTVKSSLGTQNSAVVVAPVALSGDRAGYFAYFQRSTFAPVAAEPAPADALSQMLSLRCSLSGARRASAA